MLSLDLSRAARAYDKLPRRSLEYALTRINAPQELISLILFIHDNALIVLEKGGCSSSVRMGRGIRDKGVGFRHCCGGRYMSSDNVTGYADDYLMTWELRRRADFINACSQVERILSDLANAGMHVSTYKTVILMALRGKEADRLLATHTTRHKRVRCLQVGVPGKLIRLPIKTTHGYLGIRVGYGSFERASVNHRLSQSWVAFHRLHSFLKHTGVPLQNRVRLWQSCVWSVAQYGLSAVLGGPFDLVSLLSIS